MKLLNIIKLAKVLAKLESVATDKGVVVTDAVEVGSEVFVENDGNMEPAKEGDYVMEDKRVLVVANGKITEIKEPTATEETTPGETTEHMEGEKKDEEEKKCMEGEGGEGASEGEGEGDAKPAEEPKDDDVKDAKIKELEAEIAEKAAEIESLKAEIESLKSAPVEEKMAKIEDHKWSFKTYRNK